MTKKFSQEDVESTIGGYSVGHSVFILFSLVVIKNHPTFYKIVTEKEGLYWRGWVELSID